MATVGKNILENLTTGMYTDSKVIYREYIQNACDQIDLAVKLGILAAADEGCIDIFTDSQARYISIRDNATGVKVANFIENVGDIANSNKEIGKNKGFRGIGRLCGLAYCKTLKFTTSYLGESQKSIMTCDAKKMREMLAENKKYTLDEIWAAIVTYQTEAEEPQKHYFEVELLDINKENTDLLDNQKVREYLRFVAPVPYKNTFYLRSQIYDHAKSIGYHIDEYCVKVNGVEIFKEYTASLKEKSGTTVKRYDEIFQLEYKDFFDVSGNLIAWMWFGLSRLEKVIPPVNAMRGLRLRSANIQLGEDNVLQDLFKEPRGNYYFVGEIFAVSKDLIPNSQRNYFNENDTRLEFEDLLRVYFYDVLHKLYYKANDVKNNYKRLDEYQSKVEEYQKKEQETGFVSTEEQQKMQVEIATAQEKAEEAQKKLDKLNNTDTDSPFTEVITRIQQKHKDDTSQRTPVVPNQDSNNGRQTVFATDFMSGLTRSERKLVSKILTVITEVAPKDIAEQIIEKIKEKMK